MDKYEYNLKLEEIDKLVDQGDYAEAANLADTIEWRRVRNVRTLCLISEIYEASGRFEDSKALLVRAYRRSPVGRTVLYRLVEVTTELQQYDEAIEYYTEYVQAAPHDNNRYILKYKIYKGRGSSLEELIAILEEYLGQEYTERWAYELATLYQQSGQMQKCLAACDDLVLWFHSGKYVTKALELKKRYAALTPKQQQIYEECIQEKMDDYLDEEEPQEENIIQNVGSTDGEVLAESIIAQTEKEIANQVSAHKAEMEKEASEEKLAAATQEIRLPGAEQLRASVSHAEPEENAQATIILPERKAAAAQSTEAISESEAADAQNAAGQGAEAQPEHMDGQIVEEPVYQEEPQEEERDLQVELAKSMRKIIAGVVKRADDNEEDIPVAAKMQIQKTQHIEMPEMAEQVAGQLSIDDVLLSMSDKGKSVTDAVLGAEEEEAPAVTPEAERASRAEETEEKPLEVQSIPVPEPVKSVAQAAADELTDAQKEALQYTNHPEKLLRNRSSLPVYTEGTDDDLGKTRRIINTKEELLEAAKKEILAEKTIRIPTEEISRRLHTSGAFAEGQEASGAQSAEAVFAKGQEALDGQGADGTFEAVQELSDEEGTDGAFEAAQELSDEEGTEGAFEAAQELSDGQDAAPADEAELLADGEQGDYEEEYGEYLTIPQHLRGLFGGFTEIEGLEDQIANAIIQAEAKGDDRTSRSGNILIFGAHGSGKTTIAMNIAKAIAQDKGTQVMKMAKIYAADLNRKDIAATVAKIAGGTLIIEEAGDLEPGTVEQLTTAMEFRTDGLIVILEDEQQYIHELLMRHPRFTMKFTAQIYIPEYTVEELAMFGQIYANAQDYQIGEEAQETLCRKISDAQAAGAAVAISDVIEMVSKAVARSNKFFRKLSMGKKRYDENDYIVLFPKDFK